MLRCAAMSAAAPSPSFELLLLAFNEPSRERVSAAFAETATLERHGPGDQEAVRAGQGGPPAEAFAGPDAIARWLRRTPSQYRFGLEGAARAAGAVGAEAAEAVIVDGDDARGPAWQVEYWIRSDDFANGGLWLGRFDRDGRLLWLSHRPFALRE
jgi:hypothetical protein